MITLVALVGLVFALTPAAPAGVLTGPHGIVCPTGTNSKTGLPWAAGDQYRLVFVTSTTYDAISANIADYNAFVNAAADSSTLPGVPDVTWFVIGSTATVSFKDNTGTATGPGVPIFLLDATSPKLVFDVYCGSATLHNLWSPSGPWAKISINKNESGVAVANQYVFTGSNPANGGAVWPFGGADSRSVAGPVLCLPVTSGNGAALTSKTAP